MSKISFYYQNIRDDYNVADNVLDLIILHNKSFFNSGWEPVRVDESVARRHPLYALFDDETTVLYKSRNNTKYMRARYMRLLAYAVAGHPYADLDVINYGFTPNDADDIRQNDPVQRPIFLSAAGAVGLFNPANYDAVLQVFQDFVQNPVIEGATESDVNDITILRQMKPQWFESIAYEDDRFSKDYLNPGWETTRLCHFPFATTPCPRVDVILSVRPPTV